MKNTNYKLSKILILVLLILSNFTLSAQSNDNILPKYIFFMIGDGFGLQHSILAENYLDAKLQDTATCHLDLLKLPVLGTVATYSTNSLITCSAAAGTALSTGNKTKNGLLGVKPDSITPLISIAKKLHDKGYNVGIISNATLDHATPAAFYAHVKSRNMYTTISNQMKYSNYEFFGGGGLRGLLKEEGLFDTLRNHGYKVTENKEEILNHKLSDGKLYAVSPIRTYYGDIPYVIDTKSYDMHLPFYAKKAITMFEESNKGFFIMIEGAEIDFACHANDPGAALHEVLSFNETFKIVYNFYLQHPDETLIVITADHETGGISISQESTGYASYPELLDYQKISGNAFNDTIKSMTENKNDYKIEDIYSLIYKYFGFNTQSDKRMTLNAADSSRINYMFLKTFNPGKLSTLGTNLKSNIFKYDMRSVYSLSDLCLRIMSEKVGIGWTTSKHTGCCVPVRAIGVGQEKFSGFYNNNDIPKKILNEN